MKKLIVVMSAGLLTLGASAASEVVDGVTWSYSVSVGKASVYKGALYPAIPAATTGALTIPATLGGCPVTSIGSYAFYGCSGLTSITIPDNVTSIGSSAFYGCSGLTSVAIPTSVTSIGAEAFSGCSGLTRVDIADLEKWCGISVLGSSANPLTYARCLCLNGEEVKDLVISEGVTSVGDYVFSGCSRLTSVRIPMGVTSIGGYAFYNCSGLTSVTIPAGVTSIGSDAFRGCSGLTSMTIPEGVTSIGEYVFSSCSGLKSVEIPAGVTSIGDGAFYGCNGLASVTIPEGVSSIGDYAFRDCTGLTSAMIPTGVTSIGKLAFSGCRGLTSVTIPTSVTSIGAEAFGGCSGLTSVMIPEGVTSIEGYVFSRCKGLKSVTIPDSVTSIGSSAFYGCSEMTSVMIPEGVANIGSSAFEGCSGLTLVEFLGSPPSGVASSYLLRYGLVCYPRGCGAEWQKLIDIARFNGYRQPSKPKVEIVSAAIRENDPTVMDVVYKVTSMKPTVKVRALAFQDGERSFAKVVRPTEFIEGTAKNIGDEITANEERKLSWRMSADWKIDLAKVKFEVLALDGDLLPLELTTIPKTAKHAAMEVSWNAITKQQVLDALLWLYADGAEGLTVENGGLKHGTTQLVSEGGLWTAAMRYVYFKIGFSVLSGDELKYANEMTRLGLSPSGVRQYAYRVEKDDGTFGPVDNGEGDEDNELIIIIDPGGGVDYGDYDV